MGKLSSYGVNTTPATNDYLLGDQTTGGPTTKRFQLSSLISLFFANAPSTFATGWQALGSTLTYASNNGNKEFTATTQTDLTGTLSPGTKIKVARSTTPPTQSMSFTAASSQYATKASPAGITFTTAFTVESWIYLTAYPTTSQPAGVVSRSDNATGGFQFTVLQSGQIRLIYGGSSVFSQIDTYQSIPLNRWVHVAAVISSVSSHTGVIYINGQSVPSLFTATSASTLVQVGNITIGAIAAAVANSYINGYVSEARLWSVAQSQTSIQNNMAINLVGTETNLVGLWQGGGSFADATANANTLTQSGGAIATQAANPYSATEFAIVTKVSSTTVTLFTGTDYTIPNATLGAVSYSGSRAPYGFPAARGKWKTEVLYGGGANNTVSISTSTWTQYPYMPLPIPTGEWKYGFQVKAEVNSSSSTAQNYSWGLGASATTVDTTTITGTGSSIGATYWQAPISNSSDVSVPSMTPYYLYVNPRSVGTSPLAKISSDVTNGLGDMNKIYAECAYL